MAEAHFRTVMPRHRSRFGRLLVDACKAFAVAAALLLILMAAMSLASIAGRALLGRPILGDYELVQVMCAMAVAMALPYCQLVRGHVIVDFFTTRASVSVNRTLDVAAALMLAVVAFVVAWRVARGMADLWRTGDASMLIGFPTWIAYAPIAASFALLGCAAMLTAWDDVSARRAA
jgi:TRAP-type C4-dicarboxylate transport system permease small subunit